MARHWKITEMAIQIKPFLRDAAIMKNPRGSSSHALCAARVNGVADFPTSGMKLSYEPRQSPPSPAGSSTMYPAADVYGNTFQGLALKVLETAMALEASSAKRGALTDSVGSHNERRQ